MGRIVGIDLGTTYSVIACIGADGRPEIIPNELGQPTTPSVIDFSDGHPVVGAQAKERQSSGSEEVASFFKREMGNPHFILSFAGRDYTPVDLSALMLAHMKTQAELFLGEAVTDAVITVPAYFNHAQRQDTMEAGRKAGLHVLKIINEPTAAALAYGLRPSNQTQQLMVYDLGGGTFDVSLIELTADAITVLGTGGDHRLGGRDWDDRLLLYVAGEFEREFGVELIGDDFNALLVQAERVKHTLSARETASMRVQSDGQTATYTITRAKFEELSASLLERTRLLCDALLDECHKSWDQVNGVISVGGSTRMPMVRELIRQMSGRAPLGGVNPDEAVALGAAIQANIEMDRRHGDGLPLYSLPGRKRLNDVVAHSLGFIAEREDGTKYINKTVISKQSKVPMQATRSVALPLRPDGDTTLEIYLTQGESDDPMECAYLGKYVFTGFPSIPNKEATIDVTYEYDSDSLVRVSAVERSRHAPLTLRVEPIPDDVPARFASAPVHTGASRQAAIYLAFDLSGSMRGDPLRRAQEAATSFVLNCNLATTAVGLICFADQVAVSQKATHEQADILRAIDAMAIGTMGIGRGNMAQPFDELNTLLRAETDLRYALILTDGMWVHSRHAVSCAKLCHAARVQIIAIGFGKANQDFLRQIASSDEQGLFTQLDQLTATFSAIARELKETVELGLPGSGSSRRTR